MLLEKACCHAGGIHSTPTRDAFRYLAVRSHSVLAPNARFRPAVIATVPVDTHTSSTEHAEAPARMI